MIEFTKKVPIYLDDDHIILKVLIFLSHESPRFVNMCMLNLLSLYLHTNQVETLACKLLSAL